MKEIANLIEGPWGKIDNKLVEVALGVAVVALAFGAKKMLEKSSINLKPSTINFGVTSMTGKATGSPKGK